MRPSSDSSLKPPPASVASDTSAGADTAYSLAHLPAPGDGIDLYRIGGALFVCVVLGVAVVLALRRYGRSLPGGGGTRSPRKRLTIVETTRLAPRATLHLIEYDERRVLVVLHANGVSLLDAHAHSSPETTS